MKKTTKTATTIASSATATATATTSTTSEKVGAKVMSQLAHILLILLVLFNKKKKGKSNNEENTIIEAALALIGLFPKSAISELTTLGLVEITNEGVLTPTPYGTKVALGQLNLGINFNTMVKELSEGGFYSLLFTTLNELKSRTGDRKICQFKRDGAPNRVWEGLDEFDQWIDERVEPAQDGNEPAADDVIAEDVVMEEPNATEE